MAMKWIALASILCLALGEDSKGEEEKGSLTVRCCHAEKVLPPLYKTDDPSKCFEDEDDEEIGEITEEKHCSMVECMLAERKLINEDKTVKEQELKKAMSEDVHPDAKTAVKAGIDKCFEEFAKKPDKAKCKSGLLKLYACGASSILENCPKSMWREDKDECQSKKE